jgi:hypothetical protein
MKKHWVAGGTALCLAANLAFPVTAATIDPYSKGDPNGDGAVTITDAGDVLTLYARRAAGLSIADSTVSQRQAADVNSDGLIDLSDATVILTYYARNAANITTSWDDLDIQLPVTCPQTDSVSLDEEEVYTGTLQNTFLYDIDDDGWKETIGKYQTENTLVPYFYRILQENGSYEDYFDYAYNSYNNTLIYDHNTNQIHLVKLDYQAAGNGQFIWIYDSNLNIDYGVDYYYTKELYFNINNQTASQAEVAAYIQNLEILDPDERDLENWCQEKMDAVDTELSMNRILSESELKAIITEGYGVAPTIWEYHDYDGDGTKEAFAVLTDQDNTVVCISSYGCIDTMDDCSGYTVSSSSDGNYRTYDGKGFFWADISAGGSGWKTILLSVYSGDYPFPYSLSLSREIQGFYEDSKGFYTTKSEFSATSGHTYPKYNLVYDSESQEFTLGSKRS